METFFVLLVLCKKKLPSEKVSNTQLSSYLQQAAETPCPTVDDLRHHGAHMASLL